MRFDTVIIGGGLAGLVAGISLQQAGRSTAIVSTGQNALHFFSGSFESMKEAPERLTALFAGAGIRVHYNPGVRLTPLGTFREAELSLEDISLFPEAKFADKALLQGLNAMIHPRVMEDFNHFCLQHSDEPYVLFESAILYVGKCKTAIFRTVVSGHFQI